METTDIRKFQGRTPEAVRVLAFFNAKYGKGKELEQVLKTLVAPTRGEPGNITYVLHRAENPDELLFDEMFSSMEAFKEHARKPYIKDRGQKIKHLLAAPPEIRTYFEV